MTDESIIVVFDNNALRADLVWGWGFSCVVRFGGKTILFDTGSDGAGLLYNMGKLDISPEKIEAVILSHAHGDHTNGLGAFLKRNSDVTVYLPQSFPKRYKEGVRNSGAAVEEICQAKELFSGVFTTGEMTGIIEEQAMVLKTGRGSVVITGCAHPGIVNILRTAFELTGQSISLAVGGFHFPKRSVLDSFRELGVRKVAPCHCSGDEARGFFKEAYGDAYMDVGTGKEIVIE
jgi:7,8-dihydropterin-6-yl-methyl-4-(beta-D-ribofuranosyl)aminobenzene 5'-phosphate synthase